MISQVQHLLYRVGMACVVCIHNCVTQHNCLYKCCVLKGYNALLEVYASMNYGVLKSSFMQGALSV